MIKKVKIKIGNVLRVLFSAISSRKSLKLKIIYTCMILLFLSSSVVFIFAISITIHDKKRALAERMEAICLTMTDSISNKFNDTLNEIMTLSKSDEINTFVNDYDDKYITQLFIDKSDLFFEISFIDTFYDEEIKVFNGKTSGDYKSYSDDYIFINFTESENDSYIDSENIFLDDFLCIRIFQKIKDEYNDVLGYLSCMVKVNEIIKDVISKKFEETGFIYVVNNSGKILYHINEENINKEITLKNNKKTTTDIFEMGSNFTRCNLAGIDGYIYYIPYENMKWTIIATLPYSQFIKPINKFLIYFILIIIISLVISFLFVNIISNYITKGLILVTERVKEIAEGHIIHIDKIKIKQNDEVRILADSFNTMLESLNYKLEILKQIAENGNLQLDVKLTSDHDVLGNTLDKMIVSLNDILNQVKAITFQVSVNADQMANMSQTLSRGAEKQTNLLNFITSSISSVDNQSKKNAEDAKNANKLSKEAAKNAENGNNIIHDLIEAMNKIINSSKDINMIIKVIDDIAFQTNVLALNLNIEAARAGSHGKAFAVVADEVRDLAKKSADAVEKTTQMVQNSIENIGKGNELVQCTSKKLDEILLNMKNIDTLVGKIVTASVEQAKNLDEINSSLIQIGQVAQTNTASVNTSADTSKEFASQSKLLTDLIKQFKLKNSQPSQKQII